MASAPRDCFVGPFDPTSPVGEKMVLVQDADAQVVCQGYEDGVLYQLKVRRGAPAGAGISLLTHIPREAVWCGVYDPWEDGEPDDNIYMTFWVRRDEVLIGDVAPKLVPLSA